jgi:hypothetical protein
MLSRIFITTNTLLQWKQNIDLIPEFNPVFGKEAETIIGKVLRRVYPMG